MDLVRLKETTINLKTLLEELAPDDPLVSAVLRELTPLFKDIESGKVQQALAWESVPAGGAFHHESPLQLNDRLCEAYAAFRVAASGGIPEHLLKIIRSLDNN
jgi:hypothetical protein